MELPPFHQPFGDPKYGLMVDTRDGTLLSLPAATREEQLERDRQWELYCQERGDADGVQAMDENDDEEDGGGLPPVPLLEAVRERDREIEIQDPWAEEYAASSQREVVGKKRTAVVPRCHFPVCAKSCDVVFYCPSAFPGEDDYPFPFCSPECAASWAEYEIGDTIVWNPQFDVKPATATAIRTAIEARVQRSVRVMSGMEYSSRMFGGMKLKEGSEEVFPRYEQMLANKALPAPVATAKEGRFGGD